MSYKTIDLTTGKPMKNLLLFAVPTLFGGIIQQIYNIADAMIIGQFVSSNALGSIGMTSSITFFFYALCSGIAVAISTIVGQYVGAKDTERIKQSIFNSAVIMISTAAVMSIICLTCSSLVVKAMNTPPEIYDGAVEYLRVCSVGIVATAIYNGVAGILRALGDSKTPVYFLSASCLINIALDLILVIVFKMGISGAAWATVSAQYFAALGCAIFAISTNSNFKLHKENMILEKKIILNIIKIGLPVSFQSFMISISCIIIQRYVNFYGAVMVSSFTVITKFEQLVQQGYMALETAVAAFTAQNMGAHSVKRVKQGYKSALSITVVFSVIVTTFAFIAAPLIVRCFTSDANVIEVGTTGLRCICFFYFPLGVIHSTRGVLNGCGDSFYQIFNGFFELGGRIFFPLILCAIPFIGKWGVIFTGGCTWLVVATVSFIRYSQGKWQTMSLTDKDKFQKNLTTSNE